MEPRRFRQDRRRFCLFLGASLANLAHAAPAQTRRAAETDYAAAVHLLQAGRNYAKAIAALERCVQANPQNAGYNVALGCAYAARFASVCVALQNVPKLSGQYQRYLNAKKHWDKAQTDPANPDYGVAPPEVPQAPITPDDAAPLALVHKTMPLGDTEEYTDTIAAPHVLSEMRALMQKSAASFDAAHRLAQSLPSEMQAAVEYERGSGLFLLWLCGQKSRVAVPFAPETIAEAFFVCTAKKPDNPDHWHALGLGLVPTYAANREASQNPALYSAAVRRASLAAFDRALALNPDPNLRLQSVFVLNQTLSYPDHILRLEQAGLKRSAVWWQIIALTHFAHAAQEKDTLASTAWRKGFAALGKAGRTANFDVPPFALPAPKILRAAWNLHSLQRFPDTDLIFLSIETLVVNYVEKLIAEHKPGFERDALLAIETLRINGANAVQSVFGVPSGAGVEQSDTADERLVCGLYLYDDAIKCLTKLQDARPSDNKARLLRDMTAAYNKAKQAVQ